MKWYIGRAEMHMTNNVADSVNLVHRQPENGGDIVITQQQSFRHLDGFLDRFRTERRENKKNGWFTLSSLLKRWCSEAVEYPRLRRSDMEFFRRKWCDLHNLIESTAIPADHLEDYTVALRGHLGAVTDRSRILTIIAPFSAALLALFSVGGALVFTDSWQNSFSAAILLFLATMVLLATGERGQMLAAASPDHEFLLLLDREISRIRHR